MFDQGHIDYSKNRDRSQIPVRSNEGTPDRSARFEVNSPMKGELAEPSPYPAEGRVDGWPRLEIELLQMVDRTIADFRGDPSRVYLTGLSYGGFGTLYLSARHPDRFAAMAPVAGQGHTDHAAPLAAARKPIWQFAGGRDAVVPPRNFYPVLNELETLGHREVRFTIKADLGHHAWVRVYQSEDLYTWFLQ